MIRLVFVVCLFVCMFVVKSDMDCGTDSLGKRYVQKGMITVKLECKDNSRIADVKVKAKRPMKSHSTWKKEDKKRKGSLSIKPFLAVQWKCEGKQRTKSMKDTFEGENYLPTLKMECPKGSRVGLITQKPILKLDIAVACEGQRECSVKVPLVYKVELECTKTGHALQCCENDLGIDMISQRACGVKLTCRCCDGIGKKTENMLNLRQCKAPASSNLKGELVGLARKGVPIVDNGTEQDVDTLDNPGDDEAGCHVRKVKLGDTDLCVPGNMAQSLMIIEKYLAIYKAAYDGVCQLLHSWSDSGSDCKQALDASILYYFQVQLKLQTETDIYTLKDEIRDDLDTVFKEEFIENPCKQQIVDKRDSTSQKKVILQCYL